MGKPGIFDKQLPNFLYINVCVCVCEHMYIYVYKEIAIGHCSWMRLIFLENCFGNI